MSGDTEVARWPLASLPGFPEETPYTALWRGRHFRVGAIAPVGIVDEGTTTAGFENEIVCDDVGEDGLRDYERKAGSYRLPDDPWIPS